MTQSKNYIPPDKDSLNKRYLYKLSTNFVGFAMSLFTQAIIPRGLGPKAYGDFNFLTNFFIQFVGFFDMGTSAGFYTKISQRQKEFGLVSFYFYFAGILCSIIIISVMIAHLTSAYRYVWPDQTIMFVYLAAVWGIFNWILQILAKMADAYGLTVSAELAKIFQKVLSLFIIMPLFFYNQLNLLNFFFIIMQF
jgi:O-antigen/teichoic acid export membrane protein